MRKIFTIVCLCVCAVMASAQSLIISQSLECVSASSALTQYNNQFGQFNMPDKDDSFPYVVVCMNLAGDVKAAKAALNLDLGTMQTVESTNRDMENKILFLIPSSAKNIYLTCGDGCEKQLLWNRGKLQSNKVYTCKVSYEKAMVSGGTSDAQMQAMMEQVQAMQQQNEQHVADLEKQLADMQKNQQSGSAASIPSLANGITGNGMSTIYRRSAAERRQGGVKLPEYVYNGTGMDRKAMRNFLKNNSPAAFAAYRKGNVAVAAGTTLLLAGLGLTTASTGLLVEQLLSNRYEGIISSSIMMGAGGLSTLVGVITLPIGTSRRNNAYKIYNYEQTTKQQAPLSLGVSASQNGIGLALQF